VSAAPAVGCGLSQAGSAAAAFLPAPLVALQHRGRLLVALPFSLRHADQALSPGRDGLPGD
jgi:hypothetical protein